MCIYTYAYREIDVYVCAWLCMGACVYAYMCVSECVRVCVHTPLSYDVCVCVRVNTCMLRYRSTRIDSNMYLLYDTCFDHVHVVTWADCESR